LLAAPPAFCHAGRVLGSLGGTVLCLGFLPYLFSMHVLYGPECGRLSRVSMQVHPRVNALGLYVERRLKGLSPVFRSDVTFARVVRLAAPDENVEGYFTHRDRFAKPHNACPLPQTDFPRNSGGALNLLLQGSPEGLVISQSTLIDGVFTCF